MEYQLVNRESCRVIEKALDQLGGIGAAAAHHGNFDSHDAASYAKIEPNC
jgi:hypothetical protein